MGRSPAALPERLEDGAGVGAYAASERRLH